MLTTPFSNLHLCAVPLKLFFLMLDDYCFWYALSLLSFWMRCWLLALESVTDPTPSRKSQSPLNSSHPPTDTEYADEKIHRFRKAPSHSAHGSHGTETNDFGPVFFFIHNPRHASRDSGWQSGRWARRPSDIAVDDVSSLRFGNGNGPGAPLTGMVLFVVRSVRAVRAAVR
jgi:hypothetical protein